MKAFGNKILNVCTFLLVVQNVKAENITKKPYQDIGVEEIFVKQLENFTKNILLTNIINSDYIIHIDSTSKDFIENVLVQVTRPRRRKTVQRLTENCVRMVVDYETLQPPLRAIDPHWRYYIMHMVFIKNVSLFDTINRDLMTMGDTVAFVCIREFGMCSEYFGSDNRLIDSMFKGAFFVKTLYSTVVLEIFNDRMTLYEVCYYCGKNKEILKPLYESTSKTNTDDVLNDIAEIVIAKALESFLDFNEHVYYVGAPTNDDFFTCDNPKRLAPRNNGTIIECDDIGSVEGNILKEMSAILNFKFELINYDDTDYSKSVTFVNEGEIDWAVGSITVTAKRDELVRFSYTVGEDPTRIIYTVKKDIFTHARQLLQVFTLTTWTVLFGAICFQSLIIFLYNSYFRRDYFRSYLKITWTVGIYLVDQPMSERMKKICKPTVIFWLICCININTLYKAKLTSFQTRPPKDEVKNLDSLIRENSRVYLTEMEYKFLLENINSSNKGVMEGIKRRMTTTNTLCDALNKLVTDKAYVVHQMYDLKEAINIYCRENLTNEDLLTLHTTDDNVFPSFYGWCYRVDSPYLYKMNAIIRRFSENGMVKKWGEEFLNPRYKLDVYFDGRKMVNMGVKGVQGNLYGCFLLLVVGLAISLACFVGETAKFYYCKQRVHTIIISE